MTPKSTRKLLLTFLLLPFVLLFNKGFSQSYHENFDNIGLLAGKGWVIQNNSIPLGANTWFQGTPTTNNPDPGPFNAYVGTVNAYIGVNFASTNGGTGTISNWLITPNRTLRNGDVFTFYTRKPTIGAGMTDFPDRLEVRLSTNGASTNTGSSAGSLGDFTTLLLSVNPQLVTGVYPQVWTQYTITVSGLPAPTSGRIAFRYFVTNAGPTGTNSDYIGIDEVVYSPYVCPTFTISPASGALAYGTAGTAYSTSFSQTGALGAPSYAITAGALPPGLMLSTSGTISGTPTATGTFNFTVTCSDASGCSGSQAYSITCLCPSNPINFTTPSLVCGTGPLTLTALPGGGTFSGTGVTGDTFDPSVGPQTITYDYTDPYGCAFSSSKTISIIDPGVTTVSPTTQSVCSGNAITGIIPSNTISGASFTWTRDNVASVTGIAGSGSGNINGTLTNTTNAPVTVTFTITSLVDGCNKTATATVVVNPAPAIVCPGNITVNNITNSCSATATYSATPSGTPAPTITYSFSGATTGSGNGTGSGSSFNTGVTTVTLTATNSCGSDNCSFTVTVNDTQKPTITCPAPVTVSCTGEIPAPDISAVVATDNCPGVSVAFVDDVISSQTCANRYTVTRTYRATDNAGNSETCTQLITVNDQTAPVISCPSNITATATGSCSTAVNFTVTATDNCSGTVTITSIPASGSVFPLGVTTVTSTATDACGNESTCSFTVTVTDGQLPLINAKPVDLSVCPDKDAVFNITASNVVTYQWQRQQGNSWENINNANQASYTVPHVTDAENGNVYRVMLVGACNTVYSDAVSLTIGQAPEPSITTAADICIDDKNIQLMATPAGGTFSGPGVTGSGWDLQSLPLGNHTISYTYTNAEGCSASTSKVIKLGICNTSRSITVLNAYPNPSRGKLTVKALVTVESKYSMAVTDIKGQVILRKDIPLHQGWNLIDLDLAAQKAGMYIITLKRGNGREGDIKVMKIN